MGPTCSSVRHRLQTFSSRRRISLILAGALIFAISAPFGDGGKAWAQSSSAAVPQSQAEITLTFAPLVKTVAPAVVNVYTRATVTERATISPLFRDPFFQRFFGDLIPNMPERRRQANSLGSGVIVDPEGVIVTNAHVIKGADEITVVLADRRELDAELVLMDEQTDLAVLRVATERPLPHVQFRDSDALEVGDLVLAIGNPFGVGQTVTMGIVSALARTNVGVSDYSFFIQTDAAINPGNSGGALIGSDGRLVGINTAIYSNTRGPSAGSVGIGFAVPSNMVKAVLRAAEGGKVVRPWLGARAQSVDSDMAPSFGLDRPIGAVITELTRMGLRTGRVCGRETWSLPGRPRA